MRKVFFFLLFIVLFIPCFSQDTLLLISGRKIITSAVTTQNNEILYRKASPEYIVLQGLRKNNGVLPVGPSSDKFEISSTLQLGKCEFRRTVRRLGKDSLINVSAESITLSGKQAPKLQAKLRSIDPLRVFSINYADGTEKVIYSPDSLDPMDFKVGEMRNFIKGEQDARRLYHNNFIRMLGFGIGAGSGLLAFYGLVGPPLYATVTGAFSPNIEKQLSFVVSGDAAGSLGITPGMYLNETVGTTAKGVTKGQKLKLGSGTVRFDNDMNTADAVRKINSSFHRTRVQAEVIDGSVRLFKGTSSSLITQEAYREGFSKKVRDYRIRNAMISGMVGFIIGTVTYTIFRDELSSD